MYTYRYSLSKPHSTCDFVYDVYSPRLSINSLCECTRNIKNNSIVDMYIISFNDGYKISFDVKILYSRKLITKYIVNYNTCLRNANTYYITLICTMIVLLYCASSRSQTKRVYYVVGCNCGNNRNEIYKDSIAGNTTYSYDILVIYFSQKEK